MIEKIFLLIKDGLENYLIDNNKEKNVHISFDNATTNTDIDTIILKLISADEEPYQRRTDNSTSYQKTPLLIINFILSFQYSTKRYKVALQQMSEVVRFLRDNPYLDRSKLPNMPNEIERISFEQLHLDLKSLIDIQAQLDIGFNPVIAFKAIAIKSEL